VRHWNRLADDFWLIAMSWRFYSAAIGRAAAQAPRACRAAACGWASQFGLGSVSEVEYCGEKGRWEKHIGSYSVPGVTFKAHGFRFIGWLDGTLRVYLRIAASGLKLGRIQLLPPSRWARMARKPCSKSNPWRTSARCSKRPSVGIESAGVMYQSPLLRQF
jgi:hypothetical protein